MLIHALYNEFTNDLESFVKLPIQIEPLSTWDARLVAAPERHAFNGVSANISPADQIYMLETQNKAFEMIESMVRVFLSTNVYKKLGAIDPVKEQVWLFGHKWLDIYYEMLAEPHILRSEFYRKEHEKFMGLLGKLLCMVPAQRPTFMDALRIWYPTSELLKEARDDSSEKDDLAKKLPEVLSVPHERPPQPCLSVAAPSLQRPRLVLTGSRDPAGHNKTRRNRRN